MEYFNPERYYTTAVIRDIFEKGAEFPFDISSDWVYKLAMNEIYVDENLMLHGIFSEPYDLSNAEFSEERPDTPDKFISDFQYGNIYYYDIKDFKTLPDSIPQEAFRSAVTAVLLLEKEKAFVYPLIISISPMMKAIILHLSLSHTLQMRLLRRNGTEFFPMPKKAILPCRSFLKRNHK